MVLIAALNMYLFVWVCCANLQHEVFWETRKEQIVEHLLAEYDGERERVETDVEKILDTLRSIGALD